MLPLTLQSLAKLDIKTIQPRFEFRSGQIFLGNIKKIFPNQTALVQVGQQNIIAKLEVPLINGNQYWFQVLSREGETILKMLSSYSKENNANSLLLNQLSLPNNKVNNELLAFLSKEQIPLTKDAIVTIAQWLENKGNSQDSFNTLQVMFKNKFPLAETIFQSVLETIKTQKSIHDTLQLFEKQLQLEPTSKTNQLLLSMIRNVVQQDIPIAKKVLLSIIDTAIQETAPNKIKAINLLDKLGMINNTTIDKQTTLTNGNAVNQLNIKNNEVEAANKYNEIVQHLTNLKEKSYDQINKSVQILENYLTDESTENNRSTTTFIPEMVKTNEKESQYTNRVEPFKNERLALSMEDQHFLKQVETEVKESVKGKDILELFKTVTKKLGINYEAEILKGNAELNQTDNILKPLLVKYLQETNHPLESKELAEQLVNKMNGQLLLSNQNNPITNIVYQLPIQLFGYQTEVTMQWSGKSKEDGKIDANYCKILFYLELEHLKETIVDMKVQNRVITIKIINEGEYLPELSQKFIPPLKKALMEINYTLSAIQFDQPNKGNGGMERSNIQKAHSLYSGVDIRI
ncbi:hypothetical protein [Heyndrickxia oleronia]|jgi:hypothetical protein|uniref:Flagellar hook-length control protein-like C-terminal domain-containing protein n=1 Tax=Heyndrickxia oleronia TaxID=38875 RepID=A0A8E2I4Y5_9BACI|nr:hypothetical protein [Heyndrickxia oleronia]OJH18037.1 hypothetical protein BLX88_16060 [Bacillus obstructivus]MBU5211097.1 hypothetical protein [Heyndrickxia oleronia]MCI1589637.1 hypothetical protein [Heyndrickxia oleronia]MCI1613272.1 hypothetical protein [Heyndrickxia oleronia]MCI1744598.1 hypothetical protein [Heyndrickxia oleronia]